MSESGSGAGRAAREGEITALLARWQAGDRAAVDELAPLIDDELERLARSALRGRPGAQTLRPIALAHELFMRLLGRPALGIEGRSHVFAVAAKLLRQVLVDQARARAALNRGGGALTVDAAAVDLVAAPRAVDLLDLDRALERLREGAPHAERLFELRFFAGLTLEESAVALVRSEASPGRDWAPARAMLLRELQPARAAV